MHRRFSIWSIYPLHFWHNWSYSLHRNNLSGHYNAITPTKVPENPHNILFDTQSTSKLKELLFLLWECGTQIQNVVFTTYLWSDMCILPLELRAQRKYCYICSRGSALMIYLKLTQTHSKRFWEFIRALFVCEKKGDSKRLRTVIHCLLPKILESKDYFFSINEGVKVKTILYAVNHKVLAPLLALYAVCTI